MSGALGTRWSRESDTPRSWIGGGPGDGGGADRPHPGGERQLGFVGPGRGTQSGLGFRAEPTAAEPVRAFGVRRWWNRALPDEVKPATLPERVFIALMVLVFPFDNAVSIPGGRSITFVVIGLLGIITVTRRVNELARVCTSPLMLPLWIYLGSVLVFELSNSSSDLTIVVRVLQAGIGLMLFATVFRDERAVRTLFDFTIVSAFFTALYIMPISFGAFSGVDASSQGDVRLARAEGAEGTFLLWGGTNAIAALVALGTCTALVYALVATTPGRRVLFLVVGAICLVGTVLTASRGGMMVAGVGMLAAILLYQRGRWRAMAVLGLCVFAVLILVPPAAYSRIYQPYADAPGREDPRSTLYEAVLRSSGDWIPFGVGTHNYHGNWGARHGFAKNALEPNNISGTHNAFTQVVVWWGLPTLAAWLWFVGVAFVRVARFGLVDRIRIPLLAGLALLLAEMTVAHDMYDKDYALWFGAAVGVLVWGVGRIGDAPASSDGTTDPGDDEARERPGRLALPAR